MKTLKCLFGGTILRFSIALLLNRLNIYKTLSRWSIYLKFGSMCGSLSLLYNISRYILRKIIPHMPTDIQIWTSSLISSLALLLCDKSDLNLLKIAIYPRALEAMYNILVEKGILKPMKHG